MRGSIYELLCEHRSIDRIIPDEELVGSKVARFDRYDRHIVHVSPALYRLFIDVPENETEELLDNVFVDEALPLPMIFPSTPTEHFLSIDSERPWTTMSSLRRRRPK